VELGFAESRRHERGEDRAVPLPLVTESILLQTLLPNAIKQPTRVLRGGDGRTADKVFAEVESRSSLDGSHGGEGLSSVCGKRMGILGIEQNEIRMEIAQNAMDEQPGCPLLRISCNYGLARFTP
jgi:hypothetical protein